MPRKIAIHPVLMDLLKFWRRRKGLLYFSAPPTPKYPEGGQRINPTSTILSRELPVGREAGYAVHARADFLRPSA